MFIKIMAYKDKIKNSGFVLNPKNENNSNDAKFNPLLHEFFFS